MLWLLSRKWPWDSVVEGTWFKKYGDIVYTDLDASSLQNNFHGTEDTMHSTKE